MTNDAATTEILDENEQIAIRKEKLTQWRERGQAYPNHFRRDVLAQDLLNQFNEYSTKMLADKALAVKIAGRIMARRLMGKASFIHVQDMSGRIQIYCRKNDLPEGLYDEFLKWDIGDIVGIEGHLFKTKTGELTVRAEELVLLTKALRPLPDKFHGLHDQEMRFRKRYLDLIANESTRNIFMIRSAVVDGVRNFLKSKQFLEVETPMMHPIPGGTLAKPFLTHHHTLDMPLYMRIAPELYLKRLVVGGFERVFELNRSFRNEGVSTRHNPEFTMVEFYAAYLDYKDLMALTEEMLPTIAQQVMGTTKIEYQGHELDFAKPFRRMTVKEAIVHFNPELKDRDLDDRKIVKSYAENLKIPVKSSYGVGKIQIEIFEKTAEHEFIEPTFITEYPAEVSPLARRNDQHPEITDRFEMFIAGREVANGFSELNDPEDQAERFIHQVKEKEAGDDEAMHFDSDYITALEHGLPPTAGEGIGIDRLVMLFTNSPSIREVLLFPLLRL